MMNNLRKVAAGLVALLALCLWSPAGSSQNKPGRAAVDSSVGRGEGKPQGPRADGGAMSAQEKLVRDVYARLMRYQSAGVDERLGGDDKAGAPDDYLTFELRDIRTGNVADILERPLAELVTTGSKSVIRLKQVHLGGRDAPPHAYYEAEWADGPQGEEQPGAVVRDIPGIDAFDGYTSYRVRVNFRGKLVGYRALVLYRQAERDRTLEKSKQSGRPARVEILDRVTADMNTVYSDVSPRARAPWQKYVKSSQYKAVARAIREAQEAGRPPIPDDAPIGYLPGDGAAPNDADKQMMVTEACQALTVTDLTATGATRVTSVTGNANIIHFVTPKGAAGERVTLTATIDPDTPENRNRISWQGATMDPGNRLQATVPKGSASKNVVTVLLDGAPAKEARVWVVWATLSGGVAAPTITPVRTTSGLRVGTQIGADFSSTATIAPSSIITDADRPNLSGPKTVNPPGGNNVSGQPLSGGAAMKWDMSRRITIRSTNNATSPPLPPVAVDGNDCYPSDPVVGNDDAGTGDENNDPYASSGQLNSVDTPTRDQRLQGGVVGNTYRTQLWFQEFARLEIQGTWVVISDPLSWRVDIRYVKVQVTEALWAADINGDGDMNDVVTEAMVGQDTNGDGDMNDVVGYWDNDGSTSANDNAGRPC
jgi:hypothetical protein